MITAWPDYADGGEFVTDITVTVPAVKVYGLIVDSRMLTIMLEAKKK